jgi:outer membrane lipoprotein-sorting protein
MKTRATLSALAAAATVVLTGGVLSGAWGGFTPHAAAAAVPTAEQLMTDNIKDMTATLRVTDVNRAELKKIGGAFATTYSIKKMDISYKYPNKARFEGKLLGASIYMIFNGDQKYFRTPIKTDKRDVQGQAGQKQSLMDIGIFAKDYLTTDWKPNFVKQDGNLLVFKLTQRGSDNKSHEVVWVNPKNSLIEKRQTFNGSDVLQKTMRFTNPVQIRPGIWVPSRLEIYNPDGKLGAAQAIENVKINLGVDDEVFKIS